MKKFLQKIEENTQTHKPVVMAFGRMNPPTTGHEKLVDKVKELAKDYNATHHVIISHSVDAKKNPLDVKRKLIHAKRFFPDTNIEASSKEHPTFLQHAARLHAMGHDHLIMVAGSDRIPEYEKKLEQYNGTHKGALYNFKKIEVKSAGQRDPDAEGAEGMSASKMREHAQNNRFHDYNDEKGKKQPGFKSGIPSHVSDKHAKELFRDVRSGMGIHESVNHGLFKAIFISGGPGSGKDIIIREAIAEQNAVELTSTVAISILNDKHKLYEFSRDTRREAIRQRQPLIITGTTNEQFNILAIREELEELGYETMMVFVNTTNESSKKRNEAHERVLSESVRQERWDVTQLVAEKYNQEFAKYLEFDNSLDLNEADDFQRAEKSEDISIIYEMVNWFFDIPVENEIAESWMTRHKKHNINKMFENYVTTPVFKKEKNYVSETKTNRKAIFTEGASCSCGDKATPTGRSDQKSGSYKRFSLADNICPSCELVRRQGKPDDIKDGGITSNSSYTFRTYESSDPTVTAKKPESETRFQQDNDKQKSKRQKYQGSEAGKVLKPAGLSPEYDTRGSGTVYPMAGLSNVNFKEQTAHKYTNTAEVTRKSFNKFRRESIDSPSVEMGVTGGYHGPSNKEPMDTLNKIPVNPPKKKKK